MTDEDSIATEISEICGRTLQRPDTNGKVLRGVHWKAHAVLKATVTINGKVSDEFSPELFAQPGTYEAWVRFSSALFGNDRDPDSRGMAVKLLGVPGETCDPAVKGAGFYRPQSERHLYG